MAGLQYYNYPGVGEENNRDFHYSQAVRIGDLIECSGQGEFNRLCYAIQHAVSDDNQGGWYPEKGVRSIPREINAQIDQAFKNVDLALKTAGGKGWNQVYRVNSYHVPLNNEANEAMVRNFRKYCPDHQPLYTCVGVSRLGEDDMRVEIEVRAYDPEGAKSANEKKT